ncbi:hypothetical protein TREES_T100014625 [Tupaia chinensis]|uniref:Uncharacterized protein n=1 Tax=Tupaia chinensis TaxID=246437 RepID=L9KWU3_TUPCH|nr:hypothetical protein TREES_T100014625 [Tupaia chinensis]
MHRSLLRPEAEAPGSVTSSAAKWNRAVLRSAVPRIGILDHGAQVALTQPPLCPSAATRVTDLLSAERKLEGWGPVTADLRPSGDGIVCLSSPHRNHLTVEALTHGASHAGAGAWAQCG